jgi:two-component system, OmpR family, sensor histidine kinase KdpD
MATKFAYPVSVVPFGAGQGLYDSRKSPRMVWAPRLKRGQSSTRRFARLETIGDYAGGLAAVLLITVFYAHGPSVNITTIALTYLLAILAASAYLAPGVSIFMCVASMLAYDYFFLPPVGTLNITDPRDWVALFSFLITALIGSQLSTRARQKAKEAIEQRREMQILYELSGRMLSTDDPFHLFNAIPLHIMELFHAPAAALFVSDRGEMFHSGTDVPELDVHYLKAVAAGETAGLDCGQNLFFVPLRLGARVVGALRISGAAPSSDALLEATGMLLAVVLDRTRAIEHVAKVEATRQSEQLKSILLDAITHDFRTPLTSIKVSATGLLDDLEFDREQRKELLVIIDEECDRISNLVGQAAEMARLESGEVKLSLASHSIGEFISEALAECGSVTRERPIRLHEKNQELRLLVDLPLATKVLTHLVTNAHLYSSPGQPITIKAEERQGFHVISVADEGPGIEEMEVGRIFEKFYRGKDQNYRVKGTGMGLPIAKAIVEAHGGSISVVSRVGHGSTFTFSLPMERCS